MLDINEKILVLFIKYAPPIVIIILSFSITLHISKDHDNHVESEIKNLTTYYLKSHNTEIQKEVSRLHSFISFKEKSSLSELKRNLKARVYEAHKVATEIYKQNKNKKTKAEIIDMINYTLGSFRFNNGRGYFFIGDITGKKILNPLDKTQEDKNILNFKDSKRYAFVKRIQETIREKTENFDEYYWYKDKNSSKTYKKISFYKSFEPYNFAIGAGEYIDDFEISLKKEVLSYIKSLKSKKYENMFIASFTGEILSYKDIKGNHTSKFFNQFLSIAKRGEGFVTSKKETFFVKGFNKWNWIIASSYNNNNELTLEISKITDFMNHEKEKKFTKIIIISVILTIFLLLISLLISNFLRKKLLNYKKELIKKEEEKANELLKNAQIYKNLFEENKSIILLIDPEDGSIVNVNESAIKFYGYDRDMLTSLNISDINISSKQKIKQELYNAFIKNKEYFNFIHQLANKEQRHVKVMTSHTKYNDKDVLYSIIHDVTDEFQIKNTLLKTEEEFKNLFEFSNIGLAIRDTNGKFIKINKKLIDMLGYEEKELINKSCIDISSDERLDDEIRLFKELQNKKITNFNIEKQYRRKDGTKFEAVLTMASFLNTKKEITHILSSVIDISELKRKDDLLFQQSKMASMGEMIESIAHQWRQPLSIINTIASNINLQKEMNQLSDEKLSSSMIYIQESVNYLSSTIDDFRNFFKPGKRMKYFKITSTIEKTLKLTSSQFKSHEIEIIKNIESIEVYSLENELIQVFINILNNAKDALLEKAHKRYLFISVQQEDTHLIIKIKDNAGGIKNNINNKIFDPYFTTKHHSQGTGIGLFMSQEIITKHLRGTISVTNAEYTYKKDKCIGAEFIITLPIEKRKKEYR